MRNSTLLLTCSLLPILHAPVAQGQQFSEANRSKAASSVLAELRDEDIDQALHLLGAAADAAVPEDNRFADALAAATAGLYRVISQLSVDEQYNLLAAWTLPADDRASVRILTTLAPETGPPVEFARAVGARPRKGSFATASVGKMPGLFCSAWMLVTAADAVGQLPSLTIQLEKLAAEDVKNAHFVLMLAQLQSSSSNAADLLKFLEARKNGDSSARVPVPAERSDAVLVAAALQREELSLVAEALVERLNQFNFSKRSCEFVPFLRRLRAHAILHNRSPDTKAADLFYTTPSLWVAADDQNQRTVEGGADRSSWLVHEDHVKKLAGPGDDTLLFRYPLTGTFELKGEIAELEHGGGGLTYGGMTFDANSNAFTLKEVQRPYSESRVWPFVAPQESRLFNRVNIRCDDDSVTFLSNLHPGWKGLSATTASCPWLGLRAFGHGRTILRNLELVGEPQIPRKVMLTNTVDLRGWTATYGHATPRIVTPFPTIPAKPAVTDPVWSNVNGVVSSTAAVSEQTQQNHLSYMRPLLQNETIRYEFFYAAETTTAHPALGRVVFLMEPNGIRLHWLTRQSQEWTGLQADNAIAEPLNRRGPRQLPLKGGDWNSVSVQRTEGQVVLALNGVEVYQRSLEAFSGTHFGIYHDRSQSAAKFRNVELTGDWPEKLATNQLRDLIAFD